MRSGNNLSLIVSLNFKSLARKQLIAPIPFMSTANPLSISIEVFYICFRLAFQINFLMVLIYECSACDGHFSLISLRTMDKYLTVIKDFFLPFLLPQGLLPLWGK